MADKSEWKTPSMEREGKGDGHQYGRKPRIPGPIAGKLTYIVNKRWDIGLLRALSPWCMMIMMMISAYHVSFNYFKPATKPYLWYLVRGSGRNSFILC